MTRRLLPKSRLLFYGLLLSIGSPRPAVAQPSPAALSAFTAYVNEVESRLARQHRSGDAFLATSSWTPQTQMRLRNGGLVVDQLKPPPGTVPSDAMLHHWRATAFAPGVTAADFERLMRNVDAYPSYYGPQVLRAAVLTRQGDRLQASMRVRQRHVLTVVMDTSYDISFARLDRQHGFSISRSTHIAEIDSAGTPAEHALTPGEDHGFLWRLNTYWTYEERPEGLYMQIESISLTRSIPTALAWAIRPFVESVPRESLEFTLRSTCMALQRAHG